MQYEVIILELLSRIKKLEDEVEQLKQFINVDVSDTIQVSVDTKNANKNSYTKTTDDMIMICYNYGKKMYNGANAMELADKIVSETGMNRNSAIMYLYAVNAMLNGGAYKRAISSKALKKYFEAILTDYGVTGLQKAIKATKEHIKYRKVYNIPSDAIENICDEYEKKI